MIIVLLVLTVLALAKLWLGGALRARVASAPLVGASSYSVGPKTDALLEMIEHPHPMILQSLFDKRLSMLRHHFFSPPRSEATRTMRGRWRT